MRRILYTYIYTHDMFVYYRSFQERSSLYQLVDTAAREKSAGIAIFSSASAWLQ